MSERVTWGFRSRPIPDPETYTHLVKRKLGHLVWKNEGRRHACH